MRIRTEDIAKLGQLYLQRGKWGDQVLIDSSWVDAATSKQVESSPSVVKRPPQEDDWAQGYGYQFWRCRPGGFRADGVMSYEFRGAVEGTLAFMPLA